MGLLEPDAGKACTSGSEGAGAQQCAPATRRVREYSNAGEEYQPKGTPTRTKVHDFIDPEMGKAIPYGVYDLGADEGWVSAECV